MARSSRKRPDHGRAFMVRHFPGRLGRDRMKKAQMEHRSVSGKQSKRRKR